SYALSWKPCQGDSLNLPDHSLIPVKSNSYHQAFNVKSLYGEIVSPKKSQDKLKCPPSTTTIDTTSGESGKKSGRTVTLTVEDIQKKKNDVKARTTLLLSLPNEHQLRFSKYKTARELWAAILKTFGGNEATKKKKKNLLKQQYGNFKAEGSETLEQTFNRLQVIVGQLQFMDVKIKQDDLNQKLLTSLAPEWLMHTIVWRNRGDLDTMSLDDLYNHLKVYESEVQKKSEPNSQNIAFISSAKHISGNEDGNTACVPTASTNVPTARASVATISQDTACAYIASQSSGSQIKFEDIIQIDEDEMKEMDIKWNMALLSMRADKVGWNWSYIANDEEDHALVADEFAPTEFALMTNTSSESKRLDKNKEGSGYSAVPPPPTQIYLSPKKDLSWTGLPECDDDTVTDYSRPSPTVESTSGDDQNRNPSVSEIVASPIIPKPFIKKFPTGSTKCSIADMGMKGKAGSSQNNIDDKGYWDSGCSRHMTGNISHLFDFEPFDGGYMSFGQGGCKITGKGTTKTSKLEFENVYFVKDLKYNLFSVSQICDNKNSVLFTDSECIVLGRDFKLLDDVNILLRTPRQHNMYSIDLNNIVLHIDLTCLVAKASADECIL
nr:ribonuclease H-like domain-containing protein [Tanacetum cinerariifolium]